MVNRIVVGAHYGLRDWLMQRVTAVIMLAYTAALLLFLLVMEGTSWPDLGARADASVDSCLVAACLGGCT